MTIHIPPRLASFLTLILIAISGTFLVLRATPEGLLLSDDSIAYIAGARSLLAGEGYRAIWLESNRPVTHFPPGFSSALAFLGLFGLEPLRGTRFLNALLFGVNAALFGILIWRMTPSLTAGLIGAALFVANGDLLQVHTAAMSEPLFIFFSLLAFWMFDLYFELPPSSVGRGILGEWWWLAACGAVTGLAYLTRYAGLALVVTFLVAIVVLRSTWRKRAASMAVFLAGFLPFAAGWALRNRLIGESVTNRVLAWHPVTAENLRLGVYTFSSFLIPLEALRRTLAQQPFLLEGLILLTLAAALGWTVLQVRKYLAQPRQASALKRGGKESREVISFTMALYLFAYLGSILASMTFFDAATKFAIRILAPVFISLLILLVAFGIWLRKKSRPLALAGVILTLALSVYKQSITLRHWSQGGFGYASFQWYDSQAMAYLRNLPEGISIYTNEPAAVYLYTGRGARVLPSRYDSATARERAGFSDGVAAMQADILQGRAVLALFDGDENLDTDKDLLTAGLRLVFKGQGDEIYTRP
jgi:4-amino-4-deoxy-L-arabinose transferase-like glycosyltransferase